MTNIIRTAYAESDWWSNHAKKQDSIKVEATPTFHTHLLDSNSSILIASREDNALVSLWANERGCYASVANVARPMGIATKGNALAVGTDSRINCYVNISESPLRTPIFIPSTSHETGAVSTHEVDWDSDGNIIFINTIFSCISSLSVDAHFQVIWKPDFVTQLAPLDCCHLNGMATKDGVALYVTAAAKTGENQGWRRAGPGAGIVIEVDSGRVFEGFSLPHSPKILGSDVFVLDSGTGRLLKLSPGSGKIDQVTSIPGILRGMDSSGNVAQIGSSKMRASDANVSREILENTQPIHHCCLTAIDLSTGNQMGSAKLPFLSQISSVKIISGSGAVVIEPPPPEARRTFFSIQEK